MNIKRKFVHWLIICILLTSISIYFLDIIINRTPNFKLVSKSYDEKMESYDPYIYETLNYIKHSVEPDSTVLFFHHNSFILGRGYLYPTVKVEYYPYTNDYDLLAYLKNNLIDYLIIIGGPLHLVANTTLFTKIDFHSKIYLLKINRTVL